MGALRSGLYRSHGQGAVEVKVCSAAMDDTFIEAAVSPFLGRRQCCCRFARTTRLLQAMC